MSRVKVPSWSNIRGKPDFDALYQEILVSGDNLRTINGNSLLGSGDLVIAGGGSLTVSEVDGNPSGPATQIVFPNGTVSLANGVATIAMPFLPIGGGELEGSLNLGGNEISDVGELYANEIFQGGVQVVLTNDARLSNARTPTAHVHPISDVTSLQTSLDAKQNSLVSGTSIKTVNSESLLGSGNIIVTGSTDASTLTSGTLPDARLSANVARLSQLISPRFHEMRWSANTTQVVAGSGSTTANEMTLDLQSGATANSRGLRHGPGGSNLWINGPVNADNRSLTNWSRLCVTGSVAPLVRIATGQVWVRFAHGGATAGNISLRGIQLRVDNDQLFFGSHNGTSFFESGSTAINTAGGSNNIYLFDMTRFGNLLCYLNGVLVHTFPPAECFTENSNVFGVAAEVVNNATASNHRFQFSAIKILAE